MFLLIYKSKKSNKHLPTLENITSPHFKFNLYDKVCQKINLYQLQPAIVNTAISYIYKRNSRKAKQLGFMESNLNAPLEIRFSSNRKWTFCWLSTQTKALLACQLTADMLCGWSGEQRTKESVNGYKSFGLWRMQQWIEWLSFGVLNICDAFK